MVDAKDIPEEELKLANARGLAGRGVSMFLGLNKMCIRDRLYICPWTFYKYNTSPCKTHGLFNNR